MLAAGFDVRYVHDQVGHADPTTTLAIYARVIRRADRDERGISSGDPGCRQSPETTQPRYPHREPKRSIPRQFRSGRYWARTSDLVLVRSQRGLSDHDRAVIWAANLSFSSRAATA
jgi:hypothetical protein